MVGWLLAWLGGWLDGWLVGCLVGWLVGWLDSWMVGWLVACLSQEASTVRDLQKKFKNSKNVARVSVQSTGTNAD